MEENIFVRTMGDMHLLKVLGFFLEHPIHQFKITTLSNYLNLSRETVKKDLALYQDLGYIVRISERGAYKLRLNNEMVQTLIKCMTSITQTHMGTDVETAPRTTSPYLFGTDTRCAIPRMNLASA